MQMIELEVIDDPQAAVAVLDPVRCKLLAELVEPASAAALAERLGIPRQKVNYHLRTLEAHGLVKIAETRQWGGLTERLMVATAGAYLVSPVALGPIAPDPAKQRDRLSASYLMSLAARAIREVGSLLNLARKTEKRVATLSMDSEIRFRSPAERAAFSEELTEAIHKLVAKYHDADAEQGRSHRLVIVAHPIPDSETAKENS